METNTVPKRKLLRRLGVTAVALVAGAASTLAGAPAAHAVWRGFEGGGTTALYYNNTCDSFDYGSGNCLNARVHWYVTVTPAYGTFYQYSAWACVQRGSYRYLDSGYDYAAQKKTVYGGLVERYIGAC